MKPSNVCNWIKTNLERMLDSMGLDDVEKLRKKIEDYEIIRRRQKKD